MLENLTKTQVGLMGAAAGIVGLIGLGRYNTSIGDKVVDYVRKDDYTGYSDGSTTFTSTPVEVVPA